MKICIQCKQQKDESEFYFEKRYNKPRSDCKNCFSKRQSAYYLKNREKILNRVRFASPEEKDKLNFKVKQIRYRITKDEYETLLKSQNGVCAICKQPETARYKKGDIVKSTKMLSVDHDHKINNTRGLLCNNCNRAIGLLKDDPQILMSAAAYLLKRI